MERKVTFCVSKYLTIVETVFLAARNCPFPENGGGSAKTDIPKFGVIFKKV